MVVHVHVLKFLSYSIHANTYRLINLLIRANCTLIFSPAIKRQ